MVEFVCQKWDRTVSFYIKDAAIKYFMILMCPSDSSFVGSFIRSTVYFEIAHDLYQDLIQENVVQNG